MTNVEENVVCVVNTIMETDLNNKNMQDNLQKMGMDSIKFVKIVIELEERFDIEVPDEKLLITEMSTLSQLVAVVSKELQNKK